MGTILVSAVSQITGRQSFGVGALAVMFLIGFVLFVFAIRYSKSADAAALSQKTALPEAANSHTPVQSAKAEESPKL